MKIATPSRCTSLPLSITTRHHFMWPSSREGKEKNYARSILIRGQKRHYLKGVDTIGITQNNY